MSKNKWLMLTVAFLVFGGMVMVLLDVLAVRFFAPPEPTGLPLYKSIQTASSHPGYRRTTMTSGTNIFVNDYEEACLQLATTEPQPLIGLRDLGAKVFAVPGQPISAYIAPDVGSEMPAYEPYRNVNHPPFDWRTARFLEMTTDRPGWVNQHPTTTNAALLAEVVRNLRDDPPTVLPPFPFTAITNVTYLKLTIDHLHGLLFCPAVYATNGNIYIAESLMFNTASGQTQLDARWILASPTLTNWLKSK